MNPDLRSYMISLIVPAVMLTDGEKLFHPVCWKSSPIQVNYEGLQRQLVYRYLYDGLVQLRSEEDTHTVLLSGVILKMFCVNIIFFSSDPITPLQLKLLLP